MQVFGLLGHVITNAADALRLLSKTGAGTRMRHRYSFDVSGNDLCFHSPMALPERATTLGMYLNSIEQAFLGDEGKILPDTAFENLQYLSGADGTEEALLVAKSALTPEDPIGGWLFWGDFLRREYNIEQFAFISWDDT